jgi:hypothetical protein
MLVDLPPGRYSIQARLNNETLNKSAVMVGQGWTARAISESSSAPFALRAIRAAVASAR